MDKELKVIGVDKENIKKDNSFPAAYQYSFKLSDYPDDIWADVFQYVYDRYILCSMKRRAYLSDGNVVVILADSDNKREQRRIVEQAVEETNREYRKIVQKMQQEEDTRKRKEKEEEETVSRLQKESEEFDS